MKNRLLPKKVLTCLRAWTVALIVTLTAGCGGAPAPVAPAAAVPPTTLTYAFPDDVASSAAATALIKAYAAAHPEIQITPQPLPAKDYAQQLLTRIDGDAPDLFVSADTQAPTLIKRGALLDLQPSFAETLKLRPDDFQPTALNPWQRGSALYGLPTDLMPMVMFYNLDLFAASGVANPAAGWTWNDWLADAKKLTVGSGGQISRFGTALSSWGAMVWGNGGELISADGKRTMLDSPAAAAGVQFAADMVNVHHVAPPPQAAGGPDATQLFKEQKVAMVPAPSSLAASLVAVKLPFQWAIAPLPVGAVAASPLSVAGLAVSARSHHTQEALQFADWAVGPDAAALKAQIQPFAAPALRSAAARPAPIPGAESIGQSLQFGRTLPPVEQWPQIATIVNESLVPVWQGKTTAAAAYQQVTPKINALLATG
jgi:multiple sugar transport system substrate-binding protein